MINNFNACLNITLGFEGGFANNPHDPGGITNFGITLNTYKSYVGHDVTEADMKALTVEMVSPIYQTNYWNALHCDSLPKGVDLMVFDFGVNAGVSRSAQTLQNIIHATADGAIGPETLAAVSTYIEQYGCNALISTFKNERLHYYMSLPTFKYFGDGWSNRNNVCAIDAKNMV